ncbi:inner centromere protein-like [Coccinella septempunctata]|uniref:inner centromere protein-like n=1 Tax=Coccinella septempunctata TaxID=41139 RepID=UPI001D074F3D|nr:inner centromere protein-like [Coccinella septempunctata]
MRKMTSKCEDIANNEEERETRLEGATILERNKYEAKLRKVIQQRKEAEEREIQRKLELLRIKEERAKSVLKQKEERLRLLKEEKYRRRLLVKARTEQRKKEEEAAKVALQKKIEQKNNIKAGESFQKSWFSFPVYLTRQEPSFPPVEYDLNGDDYDLDDDGYKKKKEIPDWMLASNVSKQDSIQNNLGFRITNSLFFCRGQDVDLRELFKKINPKLLKRTESATWENPEHFSD